jgi:hypothetical protein
MGRACASGPVQWVTSDRRQPQDHVAVALAGPLSRLNGSATDTCGRPAATRSTHGRRCPSRACRRRFALRGRNAASRG